MNDKFYPGRCEVIHSLERVDHPSHYTQGNIEVIDFIEDQKLNYHEGNIIKYVCRYKYKNGIEDLLKARWYLERLIDFQKKGSVKEEE